MKRTNILIIEDDYAIRDVISYVLLSEGFDVLACNKIDPLEAIADYSPELIILDEWINTQDSAMLCHDIKEIHHLAHIPVIIISTSADIEQIALSCKADGFVRKPFDVDTLICEIKRCLARETGVIKR